MRLTDDERIILEDIAARTKKDCWFSIRRNRQGQDCIYDLEERRRRSLKSGVRLLLDGNDPPDDPPLDADECRVLCALLARLL